MSDSQEERIVALVDRWIIDYFSRSIWKHFEDYGTVANDWIDGFIQERQCIQVLETQPGENLDLLELRSRLLIQFMCRMSSGLLGTILIDSDVNDGHTELEEAIDLLDQIIEIGNHNLTSSDILRIRVSVKQQAVYACCREGNFELAAKVFFRQWKSWKTKEEMEARRNIAEVLDSKNHVHEHLKLLTYEATINESKAFLKKLFNQMAPPFLTNAARNVWEHMKNEDNIIIKENEADLSEILNIKVEKGNLSNRFQQSYNDITDIADEVCAISSRNLPVIIPPTKAVLKQSGVAFASGSDTLLTVLPRVDASNNSVPMILWTNSVSPNVISAMTSTSVRASSGQQGITSYNFMQQKNGGGEDRMYVQLPASQFSRQGNVYLTTAPSFSGSQPNNFSANNSAQGLGLWNIPAHSTAAGIMPSTTAAAAVQLPFEKKTTTVGKRKYKNKKKRRGRKSREEVTFEPIRLRSDVGSTKVAAVPRNLPPPPPAVAPPPLAPAVEKKNQNRKSSKGYAVFDPSPINNRVPSFVTTPAESRRQSAPAKVTVNSKIGKRPSRSKKEEQQEPIGRKRKVSLSEERVPVICLTKISKEALQKLPRSLLPKFKITKKPKVTAAAENTSDRRQMGRRSTSYEINNSHNTKKFDAVPETKQSRNKLSSGHNNATVGSSAKNRKNHRTPDDIIVMKPNVETKRKISGSSNTITEVSPKKKKMTVPNKSPDHVVAQNSKNLLISPSRIMSGRWTIEEEEILYKGVQKYGVGHWALITNFCLPGRQPSKISAKWNTLAASRKVALMKKFGPMP